MIRWNYKFQGKTYIALPLLAVEYILFVLIIFSIIAWITAEFNWPIQAPIQWGTSVKNENQRVLFNIVAFDLPNTFAGVVSIYTLLLLRKRKKSHNFLALAKREVGFLLLPIWYFPILIFWGYLLSWTVAPNEARAALSLDFGWASSCCQPDANYIILMQFFDRVSLASLVMIFTPWFSYFDYWRRKTEDSLKNSQSRSS